MAAIKEGIATGTSAIKRGARKIKKKFAKPVKEFFADEKCNIIDIEEKVLQEAEAIVKYD